MQGEVGLRKREVVATQPLRQVRLLLVDVYSDWAGPCHVMRPLINRLMIQMTQVQPG